MQEKGRRVSKKGDNRKTMIAINCVKENEPKSTNNRIYDSRENSPSPYSRIIEIQDN
jgi:hypothetical protein